MLYFSVIALRDIVTGDILECWRHFVLACRILGMKHITKTNLKLGDALLLRFCKRVQLLFGKECITPNMHLHCHLSESMMDYGPLYSFWCFAFERYNGMLGSMPNNNRSIESQLMERFLTENQALSFSCPNEFSEFLPCFPGINSTGSLADTLSSDMPSTAEDIKEWTLASITSTVQLPSYSSKCVLNESERKSLLQLYSDLYSEPVTDILHTCWSYSQITFKGKLFGTQKSRTASSSIVIAQLDSVNSASGAAKINKFYKHSLNVGTEQKVHLLCSLSWFKPHAKCNSFGKPTTVWYYDLFDHCGIVPVQFLVSRAVSLLDKLDGESVLFVCPCMD